MVFIAYALLIGTLANFVNSYAQGSSPAISLYPFSNAESFGYDVGILLVWAFVVWVIYRQIKALRKPPSS